MAKNPLRQLSKKLPEPLELRTLFKAAYKLDDRSAAIVTTAIIDLVLEEVITNRLKDKNQKLVSQLFQEAGPLSDFHKKILIAESFNVIHPDTAYDLKIFKGIRNAFAHTATKVDFNSPEIANQINSIKVYNEFLKDYHKAKKPENQNKYGFIISVNIRLMQLSSILRQNGGKEVYVFSPTPPELLTLLPDDDF